MRAVVCKELGPPEKLAVEELADPEVKRGQVRIAMKAAGVNFPDVLIVQGKYQFKPEGPFSPGGELAGVVEAVGEGVTGVKVGDRVVAIVPWGAFAEKVVVEASAVIPLPPDVPDEIAAGFVLAYATTLYALEDRARLQPGETLAVLGAAGGVGLAAVEIGKALGARVIACASSADKLALCEAHGADDLVDYRREDLKTQLKSLTGGMGVDVVYDPVGGAYSEAALRATAWEGRFLVVGFAAGDIPKIPLNLVLLKSCQIVGVFWGMFTAREPERFRAHVEQLLRWLGEGKLRPHVDRVYPLTEAPQAIRTLMDREAKGKVVIVP